MRQQVIKKGMGMSGSPNERAAAIAQSPAYLQLVAERSRFAWVLTGIMLAIYFGYILLIAFYPDFLARPLGQATTTIGIPLGLMVIVAGIVLTAVYVWRANTRFDALTRKILEETRA
jgi:uncharacterized membrane protein (DUF485 family)